jgi:hypothetical protein
LRIRFQADEDLDEDIITGLRRREPGLDFRTSLEAGLESLHDLDVLERQPIREEYWCLTTVERCRTTSPRSSADKRARAC